jgi:hypothetical protein
MTALRVLATFGEIEDRVLLPLACRVDSGNKHQYIFLRPNALFEANSDTSGIGCVDFIPLMSAFTSSSVDHRCVPGPKFANP